MKSVTTAARRITASDTDLFSTLFIWAYGLLYSETHDPILVQLELKSIPTRSGHWSFSDMLINKISYNLII